MKPLPTNRPLDSGNSRKELLLSAACYETRVLRRSGFGADHEARLFDRQSFSTGIAPDLDLGFVRIAPSTYREGFSAPLKRKLLAVPNRNNDLHLWAETLEDDRTPRVSVEYPFFVSRTIVTNRMFAAFEADTGYRTVVSRYATGWYVDEEAQWLQGVSNEWRQQPSPMSDPDHPVTQVSWFDAMCFAAWLSRRTGVAMRVPTKEEWILAARPDDLRDEVCIFPWGNEFEGIDGRMNFGTGELEQYMWVHDQYADGHAYSSPVEAYPPNERGLHDMLGNVWVWNFTSEQAYEGRSREDRIAEVPDVMEIGADRNSRLTMQGGCFLARLTHTNLHSKMAHPAMDGACDIGFRLVAVRARESGGLMATRFLR